MSTLPPTLRRPFSVVDVETTGGNTPRHRIIEIAVVRVEELRIRGAFSTLLCPERTVPRWIEELTGIRAERLKEAPTFSEIAPQLKRHLDGSVFVAHNASFDYAFVAREFARLGDAFSRPRLCTRSLARRHLDLPNYKLETVAGALGIVIRNRHRALGDAVAAARILIRLLTRRGPIGSLQKGLVGMGVYP